MQKAFLHLIQFKNSELRLTQKKCNINEHKAIYFIKQ